MTRTAFIFFDKKNSPTDLAVGVINIAETLDHLCESVKLINFFSSDLEDLAVISKYRVVSLPTIVVVDGKNVVFRVAGRLPTDDEINLIKEE